MEKFTRDDVSTTSSVSYRLEGGFPKWVVTRPGSYAAGFEHLADEVTTVERAVFHFGQALGHWVLREIVLSLMYGDDPARIFHVRITDQSTEKLPWWLAELAASAVQEAGH